MQLLIWPAWAIVTAAIVGLASLGISAEWGASRLTKLQRFLSKFLGRSK